MVYRERKRERNRIVCGVFADDRQMSNRRVDLQKFNRNANVPMLIEDSHFAPPLSSSFARPSPFVLTSVFKFSSFSINPPLLFPRIDRVPQERGPLTDLNLSNVSLTMDLSIARSQFHFGSRKISRRGASA